MKNILYKLGRFLKKRYCPHLKVKLVFVCHSDDYSIYECKECKEEIYTDSLGLN